MSLFIYLSCFLLSAAQALHIPFTPRQTITTLSAGQIASFKPFSFYASAAYCNPSQTLTWTCGANCDANVGFQPAASGGDGVDVQFWYVGFDPNLQTIIVAHQGTDPSKIVPLVTDADFFLTGLDSTLFPGLDSSIQVHNGFADEHAKTAASILSDVQTAMQTHSVNDITVVGHSLGAAISVLDAVHFHVAIPGANVKMIGYGLPRVGNQAFADFLDANVPITHVTNKKDLVPTLPGEFLGFHHASGENHIQADESWDACPGQDNDSSSCSTGAVSNVFEGDISDHDGPYDVVTMGC